MNDQQNEIIEILANLALAPDNIYDIVIGIKRKYWQHQIDVKLKDIENLKNSRKLHEEIEDLRLREIICNRDDEILNSEVDFLERGICTLYDNMDYLNDNNGLTKSDIIDYVKRFDPAYPFTFSGRIADIACIASHYMFLESIRTGQDEFQIPKSVNGLHGLQVEIGKIHHCLTKLNEWGHDRYTVVLTKWQASANKDGALDRYGFKLKIV